MTIKTTADGDAVTTETMADRLKSVQSENWRRMHFTDENLQSAWDVFNESLFLAPPAQEEEEEQADKQDGDSKAEAKEQAQDDNLESSVPRFKVRWGDKELLEAVSDIKKPEPKAADAEKPASKGEKAPADKGKQPERPPPEAAPKPKLATKTRGGGAVGRGRGGRPKAGSSKATASSSVTVD